MVLEGQKTRAGVDPHPTFYLADDAQTDAVPAGTAIEGYGELASACARMAHKQMQHGECQQMQCHMAARQHKDIEGAVARWIPDEGLRRGRAP